MPAELFALTNAFFFALHNILTKKGLKYSNPSTAVLMILTVNVTVLWTVSLLFLSVRHLTTAGILIFVIVGLFQPGLTRLLTYKSIETVGVAITDPLRATTPMFSAFPAILLLGERMTLPVFFATLLIVEVNLSTPWLKGKGLPSTTAHPGDSKSFPGPRLCMPTPEKIPPQGLEKKSLDTGKTFWYKKLRFVL